MDSRVLSHAQEFLSLIKLATESDESKATDEELTQLIAIVDETATLLKSFSTTEITTTSAKNVSQINDAEFDNIMNEIDAELDNQSHINAKSGDNDANTINNFPDLVQKLIVSAVELF